MLTRESFMCSGLVDRLYGRVSIIRYTAAKLPGRCCAGTYLYKEKIGVFGASRELKVTGRVQFVAVVVVVRPRVFAIVEPNSE